MGSQLGRERTFQDPKRNERVRDRIVRAGSVGQNNIKKKENTKVLEYPIIIIIVGAFIESLSSGPSL